MSMQCSSCKKPLSDDSLKTVVIEHRASGLNLIQVCDSGKCRDRLAMYLLGIHTDKRLCSKVLKMVLEEG